MRIVIKGQKLNRVIECAAKIEVYEQAVDGGLRVGCSSPNPEETFHETFPAGTQVEINPDTEEESRKMQRQYTEVRRYVVDLDGEPPMTDEELTAALDNGDLEGTEIDSGSIVLEPLTPAEQVRAGAR
jgi:hypothetical protein